MRSLVRCFFVFFYLNLIWQNVLISNEIQGWPRFIICLNFIFLRVVYYYWGTNTKILQTKLIWPPLPPHHHHHPITWLRLLNKLKDSHCDTVTNLKKKILIDIFNSIRPKQIYLHRVYTKHFNVRAECSTWHTSFSIKKTTKTWEDRQMSVLTTKPDTGN